MAKTHDKVIDPIVGQRYHTTWSNDDNMTFTLIDKGEKYAILGFVNRKKVFACLLSDLLHTNGSAKKANINN